MGIINQSHIRGHAYPAGPSGRGIVSIEKTGSDGLYDIYTITYTDDTTSTFNVKNSEPIINYCVRRLGPYLYEASYDKIPDYIEPNSGSVPAMGCTSFVRDGHLYRNLDWNYAETAEFKVITKNYIGMAFITGVDDGTIDQHRDEITQLPYRVVDGKNDDSIMVSTHVLTNDFDYDGAGDKNVNIQLIPYLILTNLHSMDDIQSLSEYLDNLYIPIKMKEMNYLCQFLVTDGTTSYVITPSENGYEIVDISENPKLTNFKWIDRATVSRTDSDIQLHPTGIERWNEIDSDTTLEDLRFTKAYEAPTRLSEFIGIDDTTKESTDEELLDIYNRAHAAYLVRQRDGELWQTMHSIVYGPEGVTDLFVQENYHKNYAAGTMPTVPTKVSELVNDIGFLTLQTLPTWDGGNS